MKKEMKVLVAILIIIGLHRAVKAQDFNYDLLLKPVVINGLQGLHSFAHAESGGKWLIIGGRKDGLHARQPFSAFPVAQNNTNIYVVDIEMKRLWSASVLSLPTALAEALQATNINYYQQADTLYLIGGYGYAPSRADHVTFPTLTAVDVPGLINAVVNNAPMNAYFQQVNDDVFAVTGGQIGKIADTFYLVGGHRFDGRYNPRGNPTFTQAYTNQIRKFRFQAQPQLAYTVYPSLTDPLHLHRRDYNLVPQIFPDGSEGYTMAAGVFQLNADVPFEHTVDIHHGHYWPNMAFNQQLNQYHCPKIALYDSMANQMHTIFMGGMSQYYYRDNLLIQDINVPFVPTVARVVRRADGSMSEYPMPLLFSQLKGTGAEFFLNKRVPHYDSDIVKLNQLNADSIVLGHIYGGILSASLNPFTDNTPALTQADTAIYEVVLVKKRLSTLPPISGENPYRLVVAPNPSTDNVQIDVNLEKGDKATWIVTTNDGKVVQQGQWIHKEGASEPHNVVWNNNVPHQQPLVLTIIVNNRYYLSTVIMRL